MWAYDEVRTYRNRDSFQWSKAMPQLPYSMGEGCPGDEESVWVSTIPCGMGGNMKDYSGVIVHLCISGGWAGWNKETISKDINRIMMRMGPEK